MRKTLLATLIVAILLGGALPCLAQSAGAKPVLTVSFSGYDALLSNIKFIGTIGGAPALDKMLEGGLGAVTDGKGPVGLDKSRPWGIVVYPDGSDGFSVVAFVPVTDLAQLAGLAQMALPADGVYELPGPTGKKFYAQQKGQWAILVDDRAALANAPADPAALLDGLDQKYTVAAKANVANVPPAMRQQAIAPLKQAFQHAMPPQMPGETDEDYTIRVAGATQMLQGFVDAVEDLDTVLVGVNVDESQRTIHVDFEVTAVPGSKTAEQFAEKAEATTNLAGFDIPDAAVTLINADTITDADLKQMTTMIADVRVKAAKEIENQGLDAGQLQMAKKLLNDALDVLESSIATKKFDMGIAVLLDPSAVTVLAGLGIADGAKLNQVVKDLADAVQKEDPSLAPRISVDLETYKGITLHKVSVPLEGGGQAMVPMLGDNLDIVVAVGESNAFVAAGRDAVANLKQVIDKSQAEPNKQVPPMRLSVAVGRIVNMIAQVGGEQEAQEFADTLMQSGGKDHVTLTGTMIPNGMRVRLGVEEGVLKAAISAVQRKIAVPGGAPAGDSPF